MSKRPISKRKPFPAPVREWMECHFTEGQQARMKALALEFMVINSEEKSAARMLSNGFTTEGGVWDGQSKQAGTSSSVEPLSTED